MECTNGTSIREENGFHYSETGMVNTEQRRAQRHWVYSAVNEAFYNNGILYRGYMTDLSVYGARIMLPPDTSDGLPDLCEGRTMECYLLNRYGRSKCRGKIQWIRCEGAALRWGISFIELADDENDPFRKMIDGLQRALFFSSVAQ